LVAPKVRPAIGPSGVAAGVEVGIVRRLPGEVEGIGLNVETTADGELLTALDGVTTGVDAGTGVGP
jgi:hypothetical protein